MCRRRIPTAMRVQVLEQKCRTESVAHNRWRWLPVPSERASPSKRLEWRPTVGMGKRLQLVRLPISQPIRLVQLSTMSNVCWMRMIATEPMRIWTERSVREGGGNCYCSSSIINFAVMLTSGCIWIWLDVNRFCFAQFVVGHFNNWGTADDVLRRAMFENSGDANLNNRRVLG